MSAPGSAQLGVPFTVEFTTYAGGCVGAAENESAVLGLDAEIRSFQNEYIPGANGGCTSVLAIETNRVNLSFSATGTARIRVIGRKVPGDTPVALERTVTITP